jgi:acetyl-CoA synthetase
VAEAAAVGVADAMTGQAIVAFVTLKSNVTPSPELNTKLMDHVANEIGKFARPKSIRFADAVPKTRSGKIMRRLLRDVAGGREAQGDMTTLEDISVLASLRASEE